MAREKKSKWAGLLFGPAIAFFALTTLWKNETRFDYHRAAADTTEIASPIDGSTGQLISLTGRMDRELTMAGKYVESFTGFLMVRRHAEIYAWDEDKDSDDRVTWDLRWMSSVERNSRNGGVHQTLSSERFVPPEYTVGELPVASDMIEFVDGKEKIARTDLTLTREDLIPEDEYFYLHKHKPKNLGDERISYSGIPVPETATYFGKFDTDQGVADTTHRRTGWINMMIQDSGILHHLVAGDRKVALATMKAHIGRVKWIVRGIGTAAVVLGFFILFATILGVLFHIPIIGRIAESGSFLLALAIGLPLAIITIISSYLVAHPLILVVLVVAIGTVVWLVRRRGKSSQVALKAAVDDQFGHVLDADEMKDFEFLELAQLALSDANFGEEEQKFLCTWAKKHRWSDEKYHDMLAKARQLYDSPDADHSSDTHLMNLVRLALADGSVSPYEIKSIRRAAKSLGYDDSTVHELMNRVRQSVA